MLPHGSARPHTAAQTEALIKSYGFEEMDHSPYSPNLAPSDNHFFLHVKKVSSCMFLHPLPVSISTTTMIANMQCGLVAVASGLVL